MAGSLWVGRGESKTLLRLDPRTGRRTGTAAAGGNPEPGVVLGDGTVSVLPE